MHHTYIHTYSSLIIWKLPTWAETWVALGCVRLRDRGARSHQRRAAPATDFEGYRYYSACVHIHVGIAQSLVGAQQRSVWHTPVESLLFRNLNERLKETRGNFDESSLKWTIDSALVGLTPFSIALGEWGERFSLLLARCYVTQFQCTVAWWGVGYHQGDNSNLLGLELELELILGLSLKPHGLIVGWKQGHLHI